MTAPKYPADKPRGYAQVEQEAVHARRILGFGPDEPLPSMALFESLGRVLVGAERIPVAYYVADLSEGVLAETSYSKWKNEVQVTLSEQTYAGIEADVPRCRFSVGHEAGHVFQHSAEVIRLSRIPHLTAALLRGSYDNLRLYEDVEWQADAFSGALYMPARAMWSLELRGRLTTEELCGRFGVSRPCAERRLKTYYQKKNDLLR